MYVTSSYVIFVYKCLWLVIRRYLRYLHTVQYKCFVLLIILVERLSEKIVHFFIKAPNLVQHLLNSYYFILYTVALKLPIISCSKNLKSKMSRKSIWGSHKSVLSWLDSEYTGTLHLNRQTRDGHIQKLIKGGAGPSRSLACQVKKHGGSWCIKP